MRSIFHIGFLILVGFDLVYGGSKGGNATVTTPEPVDLGTPPPMRKLGETCRENHTEHYCTGQGVEMMCSPNSTCLCKLGYEPDGSSGACKVQYRKLGENCREKGQAHFWYFCGGFGVEVVCPTTGTCQCKSGYEPDGKTGGCKTAAPKANCTNDAECTGAWTKCKNGTCTCLEGFQPRDNEGAICDPVPNGFNCPDGGKPLTDSKTKSVQLCQVDIVNDTCPLGSFCNYWPNTMTDNHGFAGHCCPRIIKPKVTIKANVTGNSTAGNATSAPEPTPVPVCPVGVPHKTGLCPDLRKNSSASISDANRCPYGTEYGCTLDGACCPKPCRSDHGFFSYEGQCMDRVLLDSPCTISTQCAPGAECAKGFCQCKKGYQRNEQICSVNTE